MKIVRAVVIAAVGLCIGLQASAALAADSPVVGSYTFADLGQGGWAGGPLFADGTVGGGGGFSIDNGQSVGIIKATSWSPAGPGLINLCFTDTAIKGSLLFPSPLCFTLPVTGTPIKVSFEPGELSILRVTLNN
jgi:hypothetical protein